MLPAARRSTGALDQSGTESHSDAWLEEHVSDIRIEDKHSTGRTPGRGEREEDEERKEEGERRGGEEDEAYKGEGEMRSGRRIERTSGT